MGVFLAKAPADKAAISEYEYFSILPPREPPRIDELARAYRDAIPAQSIPLGCRKSVNRLDVATRRTWVGTDGQRVGC